jgi:hypothetical protein
MKVISVNFSKALVLKKTSNLEKQSQQRDNKNLVRAVIIE